MVPTLAATLGVKGRRPQVGTRDNKDLLYVFALADLKGSLRASLCYFQTMRHKVKSILAGPLKRKAAKGDSFIGFVY